MKLEGTYNFEASREFVWDMLQDPEVIGSIIPGSENLEEIGENKYLLPIKADGGDMDVIFNWQFLLEGVKSESSKEVVLGLSGEEKPAVLKSQDNTGYFYILMPIKP